MPLTISKAIFTCFCSVTEFHRRCHKPLKRGVASKGTLVLPLIKPTSGAPAQVTCSSCNSHWFHTNCDSQALPCPSLILPFAFDHNYCATVNGSVSDVSSFCSETGYFSVPRDTGIGLSTLPLGRKQQLLSGANFVAVAAQMLELAGLEP